MKRQVRLSGIATLACATAALVLTACSAPENRSWNEGINIIPVPAQMTQNEGSFTLNGSTVIACATPDFAQATALLASKVKTAAGYDLKVAQEAPAENYISFVVDSNIANKEGYTLTSTPQGVTIAAATPAGAYYGAQTLLQLLPAEIESSQKIKNIEWTIPAVAIQDQPRFQYRGVMFDPCRHFTGVDFIKKQLDVLAMFKMNVFHWHLTEDQLWTIEIKKYPELTEKGAIRTEGDGSKHGGFYTQEQIKEVVAYAQERFITIIPEIEMPGHAKAALVSHPELSCTGGPFDQPRIIWGVEEDVFCPGKEATFNFLEDVLTEVFALFPGEYIHIGGDECPKGRWKECPDCQKRIKEEGLDVKSRVADANGKKHSSEELLQSYTITRIEKFANEHGKKIIGWDEILEGGLAPSATVMSWRGEAGGIAAAKQQHDVIMTPNSAGFYLDHLQGAAEVEPAAIGGYSTVEKVYSYNPVPDTMPAEIGKYIIGVQGNLWAEYILSDTQREYMYYPRTLALAEVDWSPAGNKDWNDFQRRLVNAQVRLDYHDITYHIPMPEGTLVDLVAFTGDSVAVPFNNTRNLPMVYTLDGSMPTAESARYTDTLMIGGDQPVTINIATLLPQGKLSNVRTIRVEKQSLKPATEVAQADSGIVMRIAPGLFVTDEQVAAAQFGQDTVIRYFKHGRVPGAGPDDNALLVYEGFVDLPEDGVYGFTTDMDELWIDGELLVKNGQECASRFQRHKTTRAMAAGKHPFKLVFNDMIKHGWPNGWNEITFYVKAPSSDRYVKVAPTQLTHQAK
ncbi:family 20 glycosylhydrolase [Millionella massiliensis]|uniref:family 20 glycosylhydrolase n=1 Tax=Millionella massiliensis TaxID=1871023 RepID=UPI0008DAFBA8|nr:family 20 glycosylhydrolase [Millionella massiliensis]